MARIAGVDLPREKKVEIGLTYIFGIGRATARRILASTGVNAEQRIRDLNDNDTGTGTVAVTVNPVNDAPTINAISNVTINEDQNTVVNLTGISAGAANESSQTLTITASSNNTTLFPAGSVTVNYNAGATTGSIGLVPAASTWIHAAWQEPAYSARDVARGGLVAGALLGMLGSGLLFLA